MLMLGGKHFLVPAVFVSQAIVGLDLQAEQC